LLACSGDEDLPDGDAVVITPLGTETPTPDPNLPPTPTTTPGIALTPQPVANLDIAEAHRLENEGDLEGAANIYVGIAAAPNSAAAVKTDAVISAARLLLELEKPADVRVLLEPFITAATGEQLIGHYLLARAYAALGLWAESLQQYNLYVQSGRPALPYAYIDRARIQMELGQPLQAVISAQAGLDLGVPPGARGSYMVAIAQAYERAGSTALAIQSYRALIDLGIDDALALSRIVAIKRQFADPTYTEDLKQLLAGYPSTTQALEALNDTLTRGEPVDPVIRGLIFYRHNEYTKAEPHFQEQISLSPNVAASATAHYYLAAIQESRQEIDPALTNYARVTALDPASLLSDDALWWRARILEDRGAAADAQALFARILNEYPNSNWASDAAFRRGMQSYSANRYQEASDFWASSLAVVTSPSERERLTLWHGKALLKAGKREEGAAILQPLATSGEDDYFGIRAVSLLEGKHDQPEGARDTNANLSQSFDWAAAEAWLTARVGRPISEAAWTADNRWLRAQELWRIGRAGQGDGEAGALIEALAQDPVAIYTLARRLQAEGRIGMSAFAGQRLLRVLNLNPNAGLPKALLSLSYPPAFGAMAQRHAQAAGISPLLLLAFVRQESFFDPRAISPVGALGLTQMLPSTGEALATRLGVRGYDESKLFHADLNLAFGASYMASQLRDFGNEIFVALTAYNAGPNAAQRWRSASGEDADVFLEAIEFRESRLYVQLVAENYAIYRYLYAGEAKPTLP
jgi:soluble lytic murein transglycosylase